MNAIADEAILLAMPDSDYMNQAQERFFERYLQAQRAEMEVRLAEAREGIVARRCWGDAMDRAVAEGNQTFLLHQAERASRQLERIDEALERLHRHDYGYCLETGEPIGLKRLLLDPTAERCRAAQEQVEKRSRNKR